MTNTDPSRPRVVIWDYYELDTLVAVRTDGGRFTPLEMELLEQQAHTITGAIGHVVLSDRVAITFKDHTHPVGNQVMDDVFMRWFEPLGSFEQMLGDYKQRPADLPLWYTSFLTPLCVSVSWPDTDVLPRPAEVLADLDLPSGVEAHDGLVCATFARCAPMVIGALEAARDQLLLRASHLVEAADRRGPEDQPYLVVPVFQDAP